MTRLSSADAAGAASGAQCGSRGSRPSTLDHCDDLAVQCGGVVQFLCVERLVAGAHGVVQHCERLRHAEVVVHRRGECVGDQRTADAGVARAGEPAFDALEERADAVDRSLGLEERRRHVVERRAVGAAPSR